MAVFRYFIESLLKVENIVGTEVLMLPLAYSVGTILNAIFTLVFCSQRFYGTRIFYYQNFFQSLGASFFIGIVAYLGLNIFSPIFGTITGWGVFLQGFISGILGICVGILVLYLLKNEELKDLTKTLKTKFWRTSVLVSPQEEL